MGHKATIIALILFIAGVSAWGHWDKSLRNPRPTLSVSNLKIQGIAYAQDDKASVSAKRSEVSTIIPDNTGDTEAQAEIKAYVKEVFGKDADKALQVLSCENHALNPKAVNDNTTWGGRGIDKGLFQINTSWQGITNDNFLYDYKINTLMAKRIFDGWGGNFQAWTCGKKLGI